MCHRPAPPPPAINVSENENEIKRTYFMPVWEFKQHFDPKCKDKDLADVKKLALKCRLCAQNAKMVCLTCSNTKTGKGFGICGPSSRNKCCNAHICKLIYHIYESTKVFNCWPDAVFLSNIAPAILCRNPMRQHGVCDFLGAVESLFGYI